MNRKEFVSALAVLGAAPVCACAADDKPSPEALAAEKFKQQWLITLLANLDSQLDEPARRKLMEANGRACAQRGSLGALRGAAEGSLDKLVAAMGKILGTDNVRREGSTVHLRYSKCYCPLVGGGPERLSDTWCNCSRGWAMAIFEAVTGRPVSVELVNSIRRGAADCRFVIRVAQA